VVTWASGRMTDRGAGSVDHIALPAGEGPRRLSDRLVESLHVFSSDASCRCATTSALSVKGPEWCVRFEARLQRRREQGRLLGT